MMTSFDYPVVLSPDDGRFTVSFADVPEALTQGADKAEALLRAVDALEPALEMYVDEAQALPEPSKAAHGQATVRPCAQTCIKLGIYQAMQEQGVRKSELARRLG